MGAPGWYPDPNGGGGQRYFDGTNWGPTAPPPTSAPVAAGGERRITIHYGFVVLTIFSLLGTLFLAIPWLSTSGDEKGDVSWMGVLWLMWGGMWTIIWAAFAIQHTLKSRRA